MTGSSLLLYSGRTMNTNFFSITQRFSLLMAIEVALAIALAYYLGTLLSGAFHIGNIYISGLWCSISAILAGCAIAALIPATTPCWKLRTKASSTDAMGLSLYSLDLASACLSIRLAAWTHGGNLSRDWSPSSLCRISSRSSSGLLSTYRHHVSCSRLLL